MRKHGVKMVWGNNERGGGGGREGGGGWVGEGGGGYRLAYNHTEGEKTTKKWEVDDLARGRLSADGR